MAGEVNRILTYGTGTLYHTIPLWVQYVIKVIFLYLIGYVITQYTYICTRTGK
jgi:hypothetical protein